MSNLRIVKTEPLLPRVPGGGLVGPNVFLHILIGAFIIISMLIAMVVLNSPTTIYVESSAIDKVQMASLSSNLNPVESNKLIIDDSGLNDFTINYIETHAPIAIEEQKATGIPSSIKLAQALIETAAVEGRLSKLAKNSNNHFGYKCSNPTCNVINHCTNYPDEHRKCFFRNYKSVRESYKAHSWLILNGKGGKNSPGPYREMLAFTPDSSNDYYKKWAFGLKSRGYATNPNYPALLISVIEKYKLTLYDLTDDASKIVYQ